MANKGEAEGSCVGASLQSKSESIKTSRTGKIIRLFNALGVGFLAAFSLHKIFEIAGVITFGSWPIVLAMVASGLLIALVTYTMYPKDAWQQMSSYWGYLCAKMRSCWRRLWPGPTGDANLKTGEVAETNQAKGPVVVHVYGHLGGAIKFFMAFASAYILLSGFGSPWFVALFLAISVGFAQYFVESSELIPQSKALFTRVSHWRASPTHGIVNKIKSSFKWTMVLGHALGQGLGFFACFAIFSSIPPLLPLIMLGLMVILIIGPSTGRFYGQPFFRLGAEIKLTPDELRGNYCDAIKNQLKSKGISEDSFAKAQQKLAIHVANEAVSNESRAKALLRYFGYYLKIDEGEGRS